MFMPFIGTPPAAAERVRALMELHGIEEAMQISEGRYFWPTKSIPGDIDLTYISRSQSLLCRWNGGTYDLKTGVPLLYSVGQHAILVSIRAEQLLPGAGLYGLLHDASESYLCDIPRPIKGSLGGYYAFEAELMTAILAEFECVVTPEIKAVVRQIDNDMIFWERDELIGKPCVPYSNENDHPGTLIRDVFPEFRVWTPEETMQRFNARFLELKLMAA